MSRAEHRRRLGPRPVEDVTLAALERARTLLADGARPVSLAEAARVACLSPGHFHRLFSAVYGETPHRFATRHRVERAKALLASTDLPVTDVCLDVGYRSLGTFSRRFAETCGRPPAAFRRDVRRSWAYVPAAVLRPSTTLWTPRFVPACFARAGLTAVA